MEIKIDVSLCKAAMHSTVTNYKKSECNPMHCLSQWLITAIINGAFLLESCPFSFIEFTFGASWTPALSAF